MPLAAALPTFNTAAYSFADVIAASRPRLANVFPITVGILFTGLPLLAFRPNLRSGTWLAELVT